jgi:ABC-type transport system involved in multi-copper enzyme maturation permease subunit
MFFIAAVLLAAIFVAIMFTLSVGDKVEEEAILYSLAAFFPVTAIVFIGLSWMGATQMHMDQTKKIYSMLFTKPVSRSQVLFAKIITGLLAILVLLLPVFAAAAFLLKNHDAGEFEFLFPGIFIPIAIGVEMLFFGCYCLGLMCGLSSNKILPAFGGIVLSALLVPIVVIKGFEFEALGIIILFVVACLLFVWKRFLSMSV